MKIFLLLFCFTAFFGSTGAIAAPKCAKVFDGRSAKSAPNLSRYMTNHAEFTNLVERNDNDYSFESWAAYLKRPRFMYRGMAIPPEALPVALREGFRPNKTNYDNVYVDSDPTRAIDFMAVRFPLDAFEKLKIGVIFVLNESDLQLQPSSKGQTTFTAAEIAPQAIKEVWVLDPKMSPKFPFRRIY